MSLPRSRWQRVIAVAYLAAGLLAHEHVAVGQPGRSITPMLQERLGLTQQQVQGALGALLLFVREQLPKPEFDELARTIPNAEHIMQDVKLRGIVTRPLDTIDDYEKSLASIGIGQPLASQVAPAVVQSLAEAGHMRERDILTRVLD